MPAISPATYWPRTVLKRTVLPVNGRKLSNTFNFSVTDKVLAKKLTKLQGQEIELHYKNYNNALMWRGDSYDEQEGQFVVDKLERIINKTPRSYGL